MDSRSRVQRTHRPRISPSYPSTRSFPSGRSRPCSFLSFPPPHSLDAFRASPCLSYCSNLHLLLPRSSILSVERHPHCYFPRINSPATPRPQRSARCRRTDARLEEAGRGERRQMDAEYLVDFLRESSIPSVSLFARISPGNRVSSNSSSTDSPAFLTFPSSGQNLPRSLQLS